MTKNLRSRKGQFKHGNDFHICKDKGKKENPTPLECKELILTQGFVVVNVVDDSTGKKIIFYCEVRK